MHSKKHLKRKSSFHLINTAYTVILTDTYSPHIFQSFIFFIYTVPTSAVGCTIKYQRLKKEPPQIYKIGQ